MEKPFQNWTRQTAAIIGTVFIYTDYTVPVEAVRAKLMEIAKASKLWDGAVVNLQVSDTTADAVQLRALVSARTSPDAWDLRCEVREKLLAFLQAEYPACLPQHRVILSGEVGHPAQATAHARPNGESRGPQPQVPPGARS
jgi:hypothetical protein